MKRCPVCGVPSENLDLHESHPHAPSAGKEAAQSSTRRSTDDYYGDLARQHGDAYALMVACDDIDKLRSASGEHRCSERMADYVRGVIQFIRGKPGATFKEVRQHCEMRGDDLSGWPEWVLSADGYVTEQAGAMMLYELMERARSDSMASKEGEHG